MSQAPVPVACIEEVVELRKRVTATGHFVGHISKLDLDKQRIFLHSLRQAALEGKLYREDAGATKELLSLLDDLNNLAAAYNGPPDTLAYSFTKEQ